MQTTTYYVHETTNTRFTFENCGGCLKQIRKKIVRLLEPLKYNFNKQWVWSNKYSVYFWEQRRSFKTNQKIDHCTPKTFLFGHRKYSCQSIFEGCVDLPNLLLSYYGGVAVSIFHFFKIGEKLQWTKIKSKLKGK